MKFILAATIAIVNQINKVRRPYELSPVTYSYQLHNDLIAFNKTGEYYYSPSNYSEYLPTIDRTRTLNKDFLMKDPFFENYAKEGWSFLFSDTYAKGRSIAFIFKFRNAQLGCFDWNKCDRTKYDYYLSCLKDKPQLKNGKKCSFAYAYLPEYLEKGLKEVACVNLEFVSPYTPTKQEWSFACYGRYSGVITNDYPFDNI